MSSQSGFESPCYAAQLAQNSILSHHLSARLCVVSSQPHGLPSFNENPSRTRYHGVNSRHLEAECLSTATNPLKQSRTPCARAVAQFGIGPIVCGSFKSCSSDPDRTGCYSTQSTGHEHRTDIQREGKDQRAGFEVRIQNGQRNVSPLLHTSRKKLRQIIHSWDEKAYKYKIVEPLYHPGRWKSPMNTYP